MPQTPASYPALNCRLHTSLTMPTVSYIVKARDNAGHDFVHTFAHSTTPQILADNQMVLLQELMQTYRWHILKAAPFRCVHCGVLAQRLYNMPIAYLAGDDPVVFDAALPFCGSSTCELPRSRKSQTSFREHWKRIGAQAPRRYDRHISRTW